MFKVFQICETGEYFCAAEFERWGQATCWIDDNAHQYPESTFTIVKWDTDEDCGSVIYDYD